MQVKIGATYRHRTLGADVVVTGYHEATERVSWRKPSGPGPADHHRTLYIKDFLAVYELKR